MDKPAGYTGVRFFARNVMPIDPKLLEILICPDCRQPVRELDRDQGLECSGCGRVYPVRDGIPVMLVEEASEPTEGAQKD